MNFSKVPCKSICETKHRKIRFNEKKSTAFENVANKTLCSLDRQFKENFGGVSSIKVKKVKIMENHVNKKMNKSAE